MSTGVSTTFENLTNSIAEAIVQARGQALPANVVDAAQRGVLDWFGVALAGSREAPGWVLADLDRFLGGNPQASLVGRPERTSLTQAALVNGTAGHALDYDDTHLASVVHTTATVLPAALAVGEWRQATGAELLRAYAVGFEVAAYLGQVVYPSHFDAPWHCTAMFGTLGAATAVSVLLGLNREQTSMALGIAATEASGLRRMFGSMSKPFHAGKASYCGVLAGLLAARGFTGGPDALEGSQGFFELVAGHRPEGGRFAETAPLFSPHRILGNDFKLHACCHATHAGIDATLALRRNHALSAADVESVEVLCCPSVFTVAAKPSPRVGLEGKFSLYYCVAAALTAGSVDVGQFTDELVLEPGRRDLTSRVKLIGEPSFGLTRARVTVKTRSGATLVGETAAPRGSSGNPATWAELAAKFQPLAGTVLTAQETARLEDAIAHLAEMPNAAALLRLAVPAASVAS